MLELNADWFSNKSNGTVRKPKCTSPPTSLQTTGKNDKNLLRLASRHYQLASDTLPF